MSVVFVHGVNVRDDPRYRAGVLATTAFLKKHLAGARISGKTLTSLDKVWFPYWGDFATKFAWDMASLPKGGVEALGGASDAITKEILAQVKDALPGHPGSEPLVALAKHELVLAADVMVTLALENVPHGGEADAARFVVAIQSYATENPKPPWLAQVRTDSDLINRWTREITPVSGPEALGNPFSKVLAPVALGAQRLKQAVLRASGTVLDRSGDFASTKLLGMAREPLNGVLGRFFGDIFWYMSGRGEAAAPGTIPSVILRDVVEARAANPGQPLVIIGHSLGGVIMFDLLGHFRPDLECDLFISVGSQVGHFEEIKLFKNSDSSIGRGQKATTPFNVKAWINVYDEVDIFSYACKDIFDRVNLDVPYDTKTYTIKAHSAYFEQDRFYERLRNRIDQL